MKGILRHEPTGKEASCETKALDLRDYSIQILIPETSYSINPYYKDDILNYRYWEPFFDETRLFFKNNGHRYSAKIYPFGFPLRKNYSTAHLYDIYIHDIEDSLSEILLYIPHFNYRDITFKINPDITHDLPFIFNNVKWKLDSAITDNEYAALLNSEPIVGKTYDFRSATLSAINVQATRINEIESMAFTICWILSLWGGKYISYKDIHYKIINSAYWKFASLPITDKSSEIAFPRLYVCTAPNCFIEIVANRIMEHEDSWCYTIYWLTRALEYSDMGSIYMVLSMIYERVVSAIYCGNNELQSTKNLYFKERAQYCRDIAQGDYSDEQIGEIIRLRNAVMHGGNNSTKLFHSFQERHTSIAKIVIATILATLGYYGEFSFQLKRFCVAEIYKDPHALARSKLNFDFKG